MLIRGILPVILCTPLLAALMSAALLGELPQLYHAAAFVLIVAGIVVSSVRR
jgi:drug/metabolite transporter (DMT)-like permease